MDTKLVRRVTRYLNEGEAIYTHMVRNGYLAQEARELLPTGTKADIIISCNAREWRHIFSLRCSRAAHPEIRRVFIPILHDFYLLCPPLFEDICAIIDVVDINEKKDESDRIMGIGDGREFI